MPENESLADQFLNPKNPNPYYFIETVKNFLSFFKDTSLFTKKKK